MDPAFELWIILRSNIRRKDCGFPRLRLGHYTEQCPKNIFKKKKKKKS